jgi:cell division septum initiation protein DivIVA
MKELEVLHQKVAALVEKYQKSKEEIAELKEQLEHKTMEVSEAQLHINIMKPALDEAQGASSEKVMLQTQIDKAIGDVNKILTLLDAE